MILLASDTWREVEESRIFEVTRGNKIINRSSHCRTYQSLEFASVVYESLRGGSVLSDHIKASSSREVFGKC